MASNNKPMFHSPQKKGQVVPVPMNAFLWILVIVSLAALAALSVFAVCAAVTRNTETVTLAQGFTMNAGLLFLFLPFVGWLICAGFRLAIRLIPLEMWRLPSKVKEANIKTKGKYLKYATLFMELEATLAFGYITLSVYNGNQPKDIAMLVWAAAEAATVIFFGRYAIIAAQRSA